jgi:hypothetical protein
MIKGLEAWFLGASAEGNEAPKRSRMLNLSLAGGKL